MGAFAALLLAANGFGQAARADARTPKPNPAIRTLQPPRHGAGPSIVAGKLLVKTSQAKAAELVAQAKGPVPLRDAFVPNGRLLNRIGSTGWTLWETSARVDPRGLAAEMARRPGVLSAQPVHRMEPLLSPPNDPDYYAIEDSDEMILNFGDDPVSYRRLWHLDDANVEAAWGLYPNTWYTAATKPVASPLIAIVDTGMDLGHPDFINAGGTGTDVGAGGQLVHSLSAQFVNGAVNPGGTFDDSYGHGTVVGGIALAAGNNGAFQQHGTIGVGYNGRGMALRVFDDEAFGTDAEAAAAMLYAADNGADIINLSLGTADYSQLLQDVTTYCFQKGSLVIAAAGNNGTEQLFYPAACSGALGIGATRDNYIVATYSNTGAHVDLVAPGGEYLAMWSVDPLIMVNQAIFTTTMREPGGIYNEYYGSGAVPGYDLNYGYLVGTSMATPVVSGAASLYYGYHNLNQKSGWANVRAYQALERGALDIAGLPGGIWSPTSGYGALDAHATLQDLNARGATSGAAEGRVYFGGTVVGGTSVKAQKVGSSTVVETTTNSYGGYRFQRLDPGSYVISSRPFGTTKALNRTITAGADVTGVDFWVGDSGDTTPPVSYRFAVQGAATTSTVAFRYWGYDTETSIDSIKIRIGTSPGASDVLALTEVVPNGDDLVTFNGLTLVPGTAYTAQAIYTNGQGLTTTVSANFSIGAVAGLVGSLSPQGFSGSLLGRSAAYEIRNPGTTTVRQSGVASLAADGGFSIPSSLSGSFDLAVKLGFTLREVVRVNLTGTTSVGLGSLRLASGDVNSDNRVDRTDQILVWLAYGSTSGSSNWNAAADLSGNGKVDGIDLGIVSANVGRFGKN